MFRIAICDDEKICREDLYKTLVRYEQQHGEEFEILSFESADRLLVEYPRDLDLLFLDIAMDGVDGEHRIDWSKPGKAFIMGLMVLGFVGIWMRLMEGFAGINYQVWNLSTYLQFAPMRIVRAIPYMIIIFIVMFIGNMTQRVLPSTGNEKKDMRRAVIINTCMTASALFVLLLIQYGGSMLIGTGYAPIPQIDIYGTGTNKSCGSLDFAFGYCYMMGGTTGVVTYLYRKYGNIWAGVIPAAMFAGMVTLSGFTLVY